MKHLISFAFLLAATISIGCSQNAQNQNQVADGFGPAIKFGESTHDYGTIKQGDNGIYNFEFENVGDKPFVLNYVRSSCGCTVPQWPKEEIKPGEKGQIKVSYDTKRIGTFNKSITVYSTASETPVVLHIKGTVEPKPAEETTAAN